MKTQRSTLTLKEIASQIEVTPDTLRNWQRLGVIKFPISEGEIASIKEELRAQGKLSSRANKLYKQKNNKRVERHWSDYESSLDESFRGREGIYYTPQSIVEDMMSTIERHDIEHKLFLDPCCGSGNFLVEALNMGFRAENIYGFDTDTDAVEIARSRVEGANIEVLDFLAHADTIPLRFDYIYTNPPWGKRLDGVQRRIYTQRYDTPHSADTTALFMAAIRRVVKCGGVVGLLVQEAVFNIGTFAWLRERVVGSKIKWIKDYGRPFRGLITRAQAIVIENREATKGDRCDCYWAGGHHEREISTFVNNPKTVINFWATTQDMRCVETIFNSPHTTLKGAAQWGLGVVTGNNRRHCSSLRSAEFDVGVVRGSDISRGKILEPTLFINSDLSRYQQSAPKEIYCAPEKILYKFISKRLLFYVDRHQRYPLNSANCLVVDRDFGVSGEQIVDLLNSEVINWLFERLYRSYKILRADVESLPLHVGYFDLHDHFDEELYCQYLGIERCECGGYRSVL